MRKSCILDTNHIRRSNKRWPVLLTAISTCALIGAAHARLPSANPPEQMLDDTTLDSFLTQGGWSATAEDMAAATQLQASFVKRLVEAYVANPSDPKPEAARFYRLRGVNFDVLYANGGHCKKPSTVITTDLDGRSFGYKEYGYAGDGYCETYNNGIALVGRCPRPRAWSARWRKA